MSKPFGLLCPAEPAHGPLLPLTTATASGKGWYCPHRAHDGRRGIPPTSPFFTTAEAEASRTALIPDLAGGLGSAASRDEDSAPPRTPKGRVLGGGDIFEDVAAPAL